MKQLNFEEVMIQIDNSDLIENVDPNMGSLTTEEVIQQNDITPNLVNTNVSCETNIETSYSNLISDKTDEMNIQIDTKHIDVVQYFTHPVTLYRSPDHLYPFCKVSGTVHIEGTPINGFISADAVKTGIGRIKGYIKASLIEK